MQIYEALTFCLITALLVGLGLVFDDEQFEVSRPPLLRIQALGKF